jgi:hypothetical protein
MAILGFVLGIAATIISQMVAQQIKHANARLKLRYENLQKLRAWMESYRDLLEFSYPDVWGFWFSDVIAPAWWQGRGEIKAKFKPEEAKEYLRILKEYWEARRRAEKARKIGEDALSALAAPRSSSPKWGISVSILFSYLITRYFRGLRLNFAKKTDKGMTKEISEPLSEFHHHYYFLYERIEKNISYSRIAWDSLETVQSENLESVVTSQLHMLCYNLGGNSRYIEEYKQKYADLRNAIESVPNRKDQAKDELEKIFSIIRKYETKWAV